MDQHCPNCDQLLLPDDTICWQCGRKLEQTGGLATAQELSVETTRRLQLSPRTIYGALTLIVVLSALILTAFLGRQPRLQAARTDLPPGWVWYRDSSNDFTLFLPDTWELLNPAGEDRQAGMDLLVSTTPDLLAAFQPLSVLDDELHTAFYATGPIPGEGGGQGLLLVARSRLLNLLSVDELLSAAGAASDELDLALQAAWEVENDDKSHIFLDVIMATSDGPRRCQQQLHPGALETLLVTACAPPEARDHEAITTMLASFQRLSP